MCASRVEGRTRARAAVFSRNGNPPRTERESGSCVATKVDGSRDASVLTTTGAAADYAPNGDPGRPTSAACVPFFLLFCTFFFSAQHALKNKKRIKMK